MFIDGLAKEKNLDLHLGLEPEPLGMFENLEETLGFFERAQLQTQDCAIFKRCIGVNYDACHFAIEFEDAAASIEAFRTRGIRISKVHLSNALSLDPKNGDALERLRKFNEPTYLHQVICLHPSGDLIRFKDLPEFFDFAAKNDLNIYNEARVHFHIPLYAKPEAPLDSTRAHAEQLISLFKNKQLACHHFEIETYTWGVLPEMQRDLTSMIAEEYKWTLNQLV